MAVTLIGIDLGQSHIRVGGLVLTNKYIVAQGTKDVKVNGFRAPSNGEVVEAFHDANQVVKSFFGAPNFQAAVVVVPNSTSAGNREAVVSAAKSAGFNITQLINEHVAVAAAYAEKVNPPSTKRLAVVSVTGGVLDVSIITVHPDSKFELVAQETHLQPIEFDEPNPQGSNRSGPGGLFGLVGGAVKNLVVDPLDKVFDIIKKLLSSPKLSESPVDEVIFVGKASKSEKLKEAVKERFANAGVWLPGGVDTDDVAAYGAGVIAYKSEPVRPDIANRPEKLPVDCDGFGSAGKEKLDAEEEKEGGDGDGEVEKDHESSKKFVPISSVIF